MAEISPLRCRMIEDMTIRNMSPATQRSYIHAVSKFSRYFRRSPDGLGLEDVRAFQVHLVSNGISWAALNQTVCALRFFYRATLGRAEVPERIAYARKPKTLPVVLSADEVVRFLEAVPGLKNRTAPRVYPQGQASGAVAHESAYSSESRYCGSRRGVERQPDCRIAGYERLHYRTDEAATRRGRFRGGSESQIQSQVCACADIRRRGGSEVDCAGVRAGASGPRQMEPASVGRESRGTAYR